MLLINNLRDIVKCSGCQSISDDATVLMCKAAGHCVCNRCCPRIKKCPVCNSNKGFIKNITAGKVLTLLIGEICPTTSFASLYFKHMVRLKINEEQQLQEVIECPICFVVPANGPIFMCKSNGHTICSECVQKVRKCPLCRSGKGFKRNLTAEQISIYLTKDCDHRIYEIPDKKSLWQNLISKLNTKLK